MLRILYLKENVLSCLLTPKNIPKYILFAKRSLCNYDLPLFEFHLITLTLCFSCTICDAQRKKNLRKLCITNIDAIIDNLIIDT